MKTGRIPGVRSPSVVATACCVLANLIGPAPAHAQAGPFEGDLTLPDGDQPDPIESANETVGLPAYPGVSPERRSPQRIADEAARGVAVADRSRPDYQPLGVRVEGFIVYPKIEIDANASNNIYEQENGPGDVYLSGRASVLAQSDWTRHELTFDANVGQRIFADLTDENTTTYSVRLAGKLDVNRDFMLSGQLMHRYDYISRGVVEEVFRTREPTKFDENRAMLAGTYRFNDLKAMVSADYRTRDYRSSVTPNGTFLPQSQRDYDSFTLRGKLNYAISPDRSVFVSGQREWKRTNIQMTPDRDVDVTEILVGLESEITPLIRGSIGVGYIRADFQDDQIPARDGLGFEADVDYLFSELTTFSLSADRELRDVTSINLPGSLSTTLALGVDHELQRNLILSGVAKYGHGEYIDSPVSNVSGETTRYGVSVGALYLVNRNVQLTASLELTRRETERTTFDATADVIEGGIGLVLQL